MGLSKGMLLKGIVGIWKWCQTGNPWVSSQELYHWVMLLTRYEVVLLLFKLAVNGNRCCQLPLHTFFYFWESMYMRHVITLNSLFIQRHGSKKKDFFYKKTYEFLSLQIPVYPCISTQNFLQSLWHIPGKLFSILTFHWTIKNKLRWIYVFTTELVSLVICIISGMFSLGFLRYYLLK